MGRTFSPRLYLLLQSMGNKRAHYTFKSEIQVLTLSTNLKSFNYPEPQSPCTKEEIKIDLIGLLWGLNNTLKASLKACYVVGIKECQFPSSSLGHTPLVRRFGKGKEIFPSSVTCVWNDQTPSSLWSTKEKLPWLFHTVLCLYFEFISVCYSYLSISVSPIRLWAPQGQGLYLTYLDNLSF